MKAPTARQLEILAYMRVYTAKHGLPPSMREIATALGMTSTNAVSDHLKSMHRKGMVTHAPGRARAYGVTAAIERAA